MKHALALTAAALVLAAVPSYVQAQEAPPPVAPPVMQGAVELPFVLDGLQIIVDGVRVNGQGPFRFLLDTGAQGAGRADVSLVQALDLPQVGMATASDSGAAAQVELSVHQVAALEFGGIVYRDLELVSRDYNIDGRQGVSGVLGIDLFRTVLLTIDYGRGVIRIEPGGLPEPDGRTILALDSGSPTPTVSLTLGDVTTPARLDTGSMGGVTVGQATADSLRFTSPPVVTGQARTVSGAFNMSQGVLDGRLTLGALRLENPSISIIPHFRAANLGADFLRAHVVTLDMANHRVRITPSATGGAPAPRRYGLAMTPPRGGEVELPLNAVAPGSPAEAGGLRAGDVIVALNGVPVAELGDRLPGFMRASPLTVGFVRDGERREVTLTLD